MRHVYTTELLSKLASECKTISDMLRKLGLNPQGGSHGHIAKKLVKLGIDTSHFVGQRWNKGRVFLKRRKLADDILVKGKVQSAAKLRRALIEIGRPYVCEFCGLNPIWNGKPLMLHVHHTGADRTDNRPEEIKFACPNCHSQTDNFGFRGGDPAGRL